MGLLTALLAAAVAGIHVRATPLASARCDFNNDGFDDLAVGVPGENVGNLFNAGAVNVIYGGNTGLSAAGDQIWHQDSPGVEGVAGGGDSFGATVVCGNFNVDQYDDLAIGVPGEDVGALVDAGAVNVLYGSNAGLTAAGNEIWHQNVAGVEGVAEAGDRFGAALASGDFDDDAADDLAIGVPGEDLAVGAGPMAGNASDAGAVNVLNGSPGGLAADRDQFWSQNALEGEHESGDHFGHALASGDFNDDGFDDLAVGVPGEDLGTESSAGAVNVIAGSSSLLASSGNQVWHQASASVVGEAEEGDAFGAALAAADFNGDGSDDLAIGVPGEDVEHAPNAGAVNVLFGGGTGITGAGSQIWHQASASVEGIAQSGDVFGSSLAAGDFDGDDFDDLVAGVPGEGVDGVTSAGAANVLHGTAAGPSGIGDQIWHQGSPGIEGAVEPFDRLASQPLTSRGVYRIPYADGALVSVTGDHFSHSPDFNEYDMHGEPNDNDEQYTVVAAAGGTIMAIDDTNAEPTNSNNYVWIAHANGEWTKYTHFETGSVVGAGRFVGEVVSAGTALGFEGNIGQAGSVHNHFETGRPDDPDNPIDGGGFLIGQAYVPLICGVPGNALFDGESYTAGPC